jgi:preprotein translocase subunit SecY
MLQKMLAIFFCVFISGVIAVSVNLAPSNYYEREAYVIVMLLYMLSGTMVYWLAEFIVSDNNL